MCTGYYKSPFSNIVLLLNKGKANPYFSSLPKLKYSWKITFKGLNKLLMSFLY